MMSESKTGYPDSFSKKRIYLTSLESEPNEIAKNLYLTAKNEISAAKANFFQGAAWRSAYSNLQSLIQTERAAEQGFLSANLKGITLEEIQGYRFKEMIEAFNRILSYESTFRTNLSRVLAMDQGANKTGQIDRLYALLNYSLPQKLGQYLTKLIGSSFEEVDKLLSGQYDGQILEEAAEIIRLEIQKVYGEGGSASAEYIEFANLLTKLLDEGALVNQILMGYGVSPYQLREQFTSIQAKAGGAGKNGKTIGPKELMLKRQGGVMFETMIDQVLQAVAASFQGKAIHTGSMNNMKADHIITIGLGNLEQKLQEMVDSQKGQGERSIRLKNIKALEQFLTDLRETTGSIVFVSDKNYRLNSQEFAQKKGFGAEEPTFENLEKVLSRAMTRNLSDLENLIFVLANTGEGRINQETEQIERYLATMIGNFVFDDVVLTDQLNDQNSSLNRIHVFNLGNIYVPLSVFLEAVYFAMQQVSRDYTDYVNVQISPGDLEYEKQQDGLDEADWSMLYSQVIRSGKVSFHFFGNFIQFIKQHLG